MKRTIAILVMLTILLSLVACGIKDKGGSRSSSGAFADESAVSKVALASHDTSLAASSISVVSPTVDTSKAETSNTANLPKTESVSFSNNSSSVESEATSSVSVVYKDYFYSYYENRMEFVEWIKEKRKKTSQMMLADDDYALLQWASSEKQILTPILKEKNFKIRKIVPGEHQISYSFEYSLSIENHNYEEIYITVYPIWYEKDLDKDVAEIATKYTDVERKELKKSKKKSVWGEYYLEKNEPIVYFKYKDCLIMSEYRHYIDGESTVKTYPKKVFEYFKLKYVSLED